MPPTRAKATALLAIAAWVIVFLWPAWQEGRVLSGVDLLGRFPPWSSAAPADWEAANRLVHDQAVQFFPWQQLTRALEAEGLPPLWNPFAYGGSPLLANYQSAIFAPIEIVARQLPWDRAQVTAATMRLGVCGVGMLWLLRAIGLGWLGTLFGALAFLGSGSITILLYHPNSNVSCLLPLCAALSVRLGQGAGRGTGALLAAAMAAQYLGGHPESSLYVGVASVLFFGAALLISGSRPARWGRRSAIFAVGHGLGLAGAAVQILPFLEYLQESWVMAARTDAHFASSPLAAVGILLPEIFGTPTRPNTFFGPQNYHAVATQYAGLVTLVLALVGGAAAWLGDRRRALGEARWWWLAAVAIALVAALLTYPTPVWRLAREIPLFRISANVTGLTLLFALAVAVAAGVALHCFTRLAEGKPPVFGAAARLMLVAGILGMGAWFLLPHFQEPLFEIAEAKIRARHLPTHIHSVDWHVARLPLVMDAIRAALFKASSLGLGLAAAFLWAGRVRSARLTPFFFLLLVVDLMPFGRGYVPAITREDAWPNHPTIGALQALAPGRVLPLDRVFPANTLTLYGIEDWRGHDAVASAAYATRLQAMSDAPPLRKSFDTYDRALIDASGVDYLVSDVALTASGLELVHRAPGRHTTVDIYRNHQAWPRVLLATEHFQAVDDQAALAAAQRLDRVPVTPGRSGRQVAPPGLWKTVGWLYPGARKLTATPAETQAAPDVEYGVAPSSLWRRFAVQTAAGDTLGTAHHSPLVVRAELTAPADGVLVLGDQDLPGWRVTVDGTDTSGSRAYGYFRAVRVKAGKRVVEWRYEPRGFALGLWLSGGAFVAMVLWGGIRRPPAGRTDPPADPTASFGGVAVGAD